MIDGFTVLAVRGIPDVRPGDDLAKLIVTAAPWLADGDILVVTSKIVSKAEGALADVPPGGPEREQARERILRTQTARVVATRGHTRIVQTHHGFVMASAGIDNSNVDRTQLVLLPEDPDRSARALRQALRDEYGLDVAIIISDTMGRPWRNGLTDVALGCAGIEPLRDHRGETDPHGNELQITQMAVVDELAAAGELVKGKCAQVPVAVVRGYLDAPLPTADGDGATVLVRGADQDLFSLGTAEARADGLRAAARLSDNAPPPFASLDKVDPPKALARALAAIRPNATTTFDTQPLPADGTDPAVAARTTEPTATGTAEPADPTRYRIVGRATASTAAALIQLGADVHRLRAALAAEGLASTMETVPDGPATHVVIVVG